MQIQNEIICFILTKTLEANYDNSYEISQKNAIIITKIIKIN